MYKPFVVTFEFSVPEQASMYVIAESAEAASEGARQTLPPEYKDAKIVKTEEYTPAVPVTLN